MLALARQVMSQMELKRNDRRIAADGGSSGRWRKTALRKSEERFQKFMNSGPAVAYVKDAMPAGSFTSTSRMAQTVSRDRVAGLAGTDGRGGRSGKRSAANVVEHDLTVLNDEATRGSPRKLSPLPDGSAQRFWQSYKFLLHDDLGPQAGRRAVV